MCVAIDKELVVIGYINNHLEDNDNVSFDLDDIYAYIVTLWDVGCGPIRVNFTKSDMEDYLEQCVRSHILEKTGDDGRYVFRNHMTPRRAEFLEHYRNNLCAERYDIFCSFGGQLSARAELLKSMGYGFLYRNAPA